MNTFLRCVVKVKIFRMRLERESLQVYFHLIYKVKQINNKTAVAVET